MIELPDPKSSLSKMEMLVLGVDACRHPLLGIPIGHGNGTPEEQARNFLRSMLKVGKIGEDEFKHYWRRLVAWENAGGVVPMKPRAVSADHPPRQPAPKLTPSQIGEAVQKAVLKHSQAASAAKH